MKIVNEENEEEREIESEGGVKWEQVDVTGSRGFQEGLTEEVTLSKNPEGMRDWGFKYGGYR